MTITTQPTLAVGAIVLHHDAVLLVKRATPPCVNEWAIPGGKVHLGETLQQAAEREILEETGIRIRAKEVVYHFEIIAPDAQQNIRWHYIILDLEAEYLSGTPSANSDASAARWVTRQEFSHLPINNATRQLLKEKYRFP
ncbi:MAG: NUDIX hydrolase [Gammaproteobacteria bacterium]|nr:NUDIX hydrolase [Gammaproteobacteria bacterium]